MALAMGSCKKNDQNTKSINNGQAVSHFDPRHITDMNAYLKEFKQKMKQSQFAKDSETMSLEEAAWHLSSVANYDFANANVEFTDLHYDTIFTSIAVADGEVCISDLCAVYDEVSSEIDQYYQDLDLENKHFRFINSSISENGEVSVSLLVSYGDDYHIWYPSDTVYCDMYFNDGPYYADGNGLITLKDVLNIIESHPTEPIPGRIYYTITRFEQPLFKHYIDPYGSPNFINSRIYCTQGYFHEDITNYMCYYLCSYHALGHELLHTGHQYNECIVCWDLGWDIYDGCPYPDKGEDLPSAPQTGYHILTIYYGYPNVPDGYGGFDY